ncbi:MAG: cell division protein FtsA [Dehalococcoidales bacterium]|nr:cell division protein FtsA [Dehalococcoidales bacterium]
MKKGTLAAIDVGTTKVCTTIAEAENGKILRVIGIGITPSSGMHKGLVVGIDDAKQSIRESVRKAEYASGHKVESAYIGVTGRHVSSFNRRGAVTIARRDKMVGFDDLKRVIRSARTFHIPNGQRLLHIIPRSYAVDGSTGVNDPVGMHGSKLDVETHIITAAAASMKNIASCIQGLGIGIEELVLEPLASSEAVLTEEERQKGVILADIGGGTTDVAIFRDGSIWHTAIIPVAGYQLTRDIAIGLGLPFNAAEELKKSHGSVTPIIEGRLETPRRDEDGRSTTSQQLRGILRARVEEILGLILLELPQSKYEAMVPSGLVLTGGSSNLAGIDTLGHQILRLPVRVGLPVDIPGTSDTLHDPAYATNVGLLLWGAKQQIAPELKSRSLNDNLRRLVTQLRSFSYLVRRFPTWNR